MEEHQKRNLGSDATPLNRQCGIRTTESYKWHSHHSNLSETHRDTQRHTETHTIRPHLGYVECKHDDAFVA